MNDPSITYYATAVIAAILLVERGYRLTVARSPLRWPVITLLALITVIQFSAAPTTIGWLNAATGIPNFSAVWVYCLVVASACNALVLIAFWRYPPEHVWPQARRWIIAYSVVIAALIVLFAAGEAPVEQRVAFDTFYARTPPINVFIILYLVAYLFGAVTVTAMVWRWSAVAGRPWLRRGLRVIGVGTALAACFALAKLTAVFARLLYDADLDFLSSQVAPGIAAIALPIFAIGFAMPAAGQRLSRAAAWLHRYRDYRALAPLCDALQQAVPALPERDSVRLPRDLDIRVTHRLTLIRDGQLALRAYLDPAATAHAHELADQAGLHGADRDAVIEAARYAAAITNKRRGQRPAIPDASRVDTDGGDAVSELAWLAHVARAFARSPIVQAVATSPPPGHDVEQTAPAGHPRHRPT